MSNGAVGNLYKRIIDAVLESARTDFEESGVDGRTIDDMREIWQRHLSGMKRAHFPWEPDKQSEAAPVPSTSHASSVTASAPPKQEPAPAPSLPPAVTTQAAQPHAPIKQESTFDTSFLNLPATGAYNQNPHYAQQRALNNIQQKFGPQAGGSLAGGGVDQNGSSAPQRSPPASYGQPSAKRVKTEGGLASSQTDGAGDTPSPQWHDIMAVRAAVPVEQRARADRMLRQTVLENQRSLEAGGLLLPLEDRHTLSTSKRKASSRRARGSSSTKTALDLSDSSMSMPPSSGLPQLDGADDEEDDDEEKYPDEEDVINSDLDDPEDENVENALAGDGPEGDTILCLYDKVQRVKNKWKCQLKDGVCTIDGKDYVFNKANGEFEW